MARHTKLAAKIRVMARRTKYIVNEMVWDLVTSKGNCHLAKVTTIPVTGVFKKVQGKLARAEFILGPNGKWHTATCYFPVDPITEKALSLALKEYKTHEKRVGEKLRLEAVERAEHRKLEAQLKALQNTTIEIQCKTRDGKKLLKSHSQWDLVAFLKQEGWSNVYYDCISVFKEINCIGTHQFWVRLNGNAEFGTEVTLVIEPEPGDAERRAAEEAKKKATKQKRTETTAKKKAAKEEKARLAAEEAARIETEKEETAKKAAEKKVKKKAAKEEKARLAAEEEAEKEEATKKAAEKKAKKKKPAKKKTASKKSTVRNTRQKKISRF